VQRPTASAVLANMYLGQLRYVLSDYIDRHSPRFLSALGGMFDPVPLPSVFLMRSGWLQPAWWGYPLAGVGAAAPRCNTSPIVAAHRPGPD